MSWIWFLAPLVLVAFAVFWFARTSDPVPAGRQIGVETLETTLEEAGLEHDSTRLPDPDILRPHISKHDEFLGAIKARRGNKRTILVALGDRLVAGEATLGSMGAEVITVAWEDVDEFEQTYDIGGELRVATDRDEYTYTHLPRSQTREFAEVVEGRVNRDPES